MGTEDDNDINLFIANCSLLMLIARIAAPLLIFACFRVFRRFYNGERHCRVRVSREMFFPINSIPMSESFPQVTGRFLPMSETFPQVTGRILPMSETFPQVTGRILPMSETFPVTVGKVSSYVGRSFDGVKQVSPYG
jgi:hypothetical protein